MKQTYTISLTKEQLDQLELIVDSFTPKDRLTYLISSKIKHAIFDNDDRFMGYYPDIIDSNFYSA